jgi:hypothetical protein
MPQRHCCSESAARDQLLDSDLAAELAIMSARDATDSAAAMLAEDLVALGRTERGGSEGGLQLWRRGRRGCARGIVRRATRRRCRWPRIVGSSNECCRRRKLLLVVGCLVHRLGARRARRGPHRNTIECPEPYHRVSEHSEHIYHVAFCAECNPARSSGAVTARCRMSGGARSQRSVHRSCAHICSPSAGSPRACALARPRAPKTSIT